MKLAAIDQLVQRLSVPEAAKAKKADLAAIAHGFETVDDAVRTEHVFRSETESLAHPAIQCHPRMELNKVDSISTESG